MSTLPSHSPPPPPRPSPCPLACLCSRCTYIIAIGGASGSGKSICSCFLQLRLASLLETKSQNQTPKIKLRQAQLHSNSVDSTATSATPPLSKRNLFHVNELTSSSSSHSHPDSNPSSPLPSFSPSLHPICSHCHQQVPSSSFSSSPSSRPSSLSSFPPPLLSTNHHSHSPSLSSFFSSSIPIRQFHVDHYFNVSAAKPFQASNGMNYKNIEHPAAIDYGKLEQDLRQHVLQSKQKWIQQNQGGGGGGNCSKCGNHNEDVSSSSNDPPRVVVIIEGFLVYSAPISLLSLFNCCIFVYADSMTCGLRRFKRTQTAAKAAVAAAQQSPTIQPAIPTVAQEKPINLNSSPNSNLLNHISASQSSNDQLTVTLSSVTTSSDSTSSSSSSFTLLSSSSSNSTSVPAVSLAAPTASTTTTTTTTTTSSAPNFAQFFTFFSELVWPSHLQYNSHLLRPLALHHSSPTSTLHPSNGVTSSLSVSPSSNSHQLTTIAAFDSSLSSHETRILQVQIHSNDVMPNIVVKQPPISKPTAIEQLVKDNQTQSTTLSNISPAPASSNSSLNTTSSTSSSSNSHSPSAPLLPPPILFVSSLVPVHTMFTLALQHIASQDHQFKEIISKHQEMLGITKTEGTEEGEGEGEYEEGEIEKQGEETTNQYFLLDSERQKLLDAIESAHGKRPQLQLSRPNSCSFSTSYSFFSSSSSSSSSSSFPSPPSPRSRIYSDNTSSPCHDPSSSGGTRSAVGGHLSLLLDKSHRASFGSPSSNTSERRIGSIGSGDGASNNNGNISSGVATAIDSVIKLANDSIKVSQINAEPEANREVTTAEEPEEQTDLDLLDLYCFAARRKHKSGASAPPPELQK